MTSGSFEFIRDLLKERSGLVVTPQKTYLIDIRLIPVARRHGYASIAEMVRALQAEPVEALLVEIAEAMNTHESLFFRDQEPFVLFQDILLPELLKRRADKRCIRIWCAACSTGQEPYSLAMALSEQAAKLRGWTVEIIATDISYSVLERAQRGLYNQFETQRGLPVKMLVKHFVQDGETLRSGW